MTTTCTTLFSKDFLVRLEAEYLDLDHDGLLDTLMNGVGLSFHDAILELAKWKDITPEYAKKRDQIPKASPKKEAEEPFSGLPLTTILEMEIRGWIERMADGKEKWSMPLKMDAVLRSLSYIAAKWLVQGAGFACSGENQRIFVEDLEEWKHKFIKYHLYKEFIEDEDSKKSN